MKLEYDPNKNERNIIERQLSFEDVKYFDFETALYEIDNRKDYGEKRIIAIGFLFKRLHVLCFKKIPEGIRIISFRKANQREVTYYEAQKITIN